MPFFSASDILVVVPRHFKKIFNEFAIFFINVNANKNDWNCWLGYKFYLVDLNGETIEILHFRIFLDLF